MNYKYVYLGFIKDGKQEIHKVEFGEFFPHPLGLSDFTERLQASIRDTVVEDSTYKTVTYISSVSKDDVKKFYIMGDNLTNLGIDPNTVVGVSTKDGITLNNFNLNVGGNSTDRKPTCGPYKVKGNQLASQSPIWNSAYLDKNNTTFQTFVNCDLPAGSFHGWFCHQVTQGTGADFIFLYLVSSNFWEEGEVPPFGNTTPTGTIGGYGTYDDTSDSVPVPDNYIDGIYANAFGGNGMHLYGVSGEGLKNFLSKVYTTDFWQHWANTLFNPMDGIISCLYLPINYGLINGANTNSVHVSNAELETGEGKVKILYNYTYDTSTGVLPVEEYFGSFLDYAPYTSAELYLPFYGTVPINIDSIMGGSIKVQYRINLVTGTFSVFVICVDRFGIQTILQYAGSCGMSIPIVSGNNGAQNRITDLVQGIANVALGNYVGAGMNAVNALTEKGYVYTNSKISGSAGYDGVKDAFLTITRPVLSNPEKYSEIKQRPADMFVKLSELSGEYSIEKQNLDIHDKNITDEEITEIENILQEGAIF